MYYGLTPVQYKQVEEDFSKAPLSREIKDFFWGKNGCSDEELFYMKYLYAYMSVSDMAAYPCGLFLKNVRDALQALRMVRWGDRITGELFLCYVLPLRINNEDLVDFRGRFFQELYPRVKALSMQDAVLEINYWCFEKATYHATDDRTTSPLATIRNAFGRCGEESVLCVAALRSMGIPARQCYTPYWAHCDDNHAWTEVWIDGKWHCIGACEPEPVPDKGWFVETSKRAMLVHARTFSRIVTQEEITNQTPIISQVDILPHYAKTKRLTIRVTDSVGKPVEGASVRFELINYSELCPLTEISTDKNGETHLVTGYGELFIHVSRNGRFLHKKADRFCTELDFDMDQAVLEDTRDFDLDLVPPPAQDAAEVPVSPEKAARHEEKISRALKIRRDFEAAFITGKAAEEFAAGFPAYRKEIASLLSLSHGNHEEIGGFLKADLGMELRYKVMLLKQLREKDLSDITSEILTDHLKGAYPYRHEYEEKIFSEAILRPYAKKEMITPYRSRLQSFFSEGQKDSFRKDPAGVYGYVEETISDCGAWNYGTVSAPPYELLKYGCGNKISRKIAFVAVCRTLGIPARINEVDNETEYWQNGDWHIVGGRKQAERNCLLKVVDKCPDIPLTYAKNFTVGSLKNGVYETLDLSGQPIDGDSAAYRLEEGDYRIITSRRMLDGTVLAKLYHVKLEAGQTAEIEIGFRDPASLQERKVLLPSVPLKPGTGSLTNTHDFLIHQKRSALAFIKTAKEPTEHLLNEILDRKEEFSKHGGQILFVVDGEDALQNPLLSKVIGAAGIRAAAAQNFQESFEEVLESLGSENKNIPLVLGFQNDGTCLFHISGYNVGTGELILHTLEEK